LQTFAIYLKKYGKFKLNVDIATWSNFWNFTALARQSLVDKFLTMETYTTNISRFDSNVKKMIQYFGTTRTGIGLDSNINGFSNGTYTHMLNTLNKYKINELDIWHDEVVASNEFWKFLYDFRQL